MFDPTWLAASWSALVMVVVSGIGVYLMLLLLARLDGLRSFSQMSSFDFVITVAFGAVIGTTLLSDDPPLAAGMVGLIVLFGIQRMVSTSRRKWRFIQRLVDNQPELLMANGEILSDKLDDTRITVADLRSKLRQADITHRDQVLAVVLETTGAISVIRKSDQFEDWILEGVDGAEVLDL